MSSARKLALRRAPRQPAPTPGARMVHGAPGREPVHGRLPATLAHRYAALPPHLPAGPLPVWLHKRAPATRKRMAGPRHRLPPVGLRLPGLRRVAAARRRHRRRVARNRSLSATRPWRNTPPFVLFSIPSMGLNRAATPRHRTQACQEKNGMPLTPATPALDLCPGAIGAPFRLWVTTMRATATTRAARVPPPIPTLGRLPPMSAGRKVLPVHNCEFHVGTNASATKTRPFGAFRRHSNRRRLPRTTSRRSRLLQMRWVRARLCGCASTDIAGSLDPAPCGQTGMSLSTDHEVVQQADINQSQGLLQPRRNRPVSSRGIQVARRMVMESNDRASIQLQ